MNSDSEFWIWSQTQNKGSIDFGMLRTVACSVLYQPDTQSLTNSTCLEIIKFELILILIIFMTGCNVVYAQEIQIFLNPSHLLKSNITHIHHDFSDFYSYLS